MQLKNYQKRVLSDLDTFMRNLIELKNIPGAYTQTWLEMAWKLALAAACKNTRTLLNMFPTSVSKFPQVAGKHCLLVPR